jgi:hypothetical protein
MPYKRLTRWIERYGPESLKRQVTSGTLIRTESFESPSYLRTTENVELLKDYTGEGRSEYYTHIPDEKKCVYLR